MGWSEPTLTDGGRRHVRSFIAFRAGMRPGPLRSGTPRTMEPTRETRGRLPYLHQQARHDGSASTRGVPWSGFLVRRGGLHSASCLASSLCGEISELVTFRAENRLGESPQVATEYLLALGLGQVGVENLGQFGGVGARGTVSAPHEAVNPHLGNGEIDLSGMGVGAAELDVDVAELADGAHTQLPVAARMAADQWRLRKAPGQKRDILRRGLAGQVGAAGSARLAAHLVPGVNVYERVQLGGLPDDHVVVRMAAADAARVAPVILDTDARSVADPFVDLLTTAKRVGRVDGDQTADSVGIRFEELAKLLLLFGGQPLAQRVGGGAGDV